MVESSWPMERICATIRVWSSRHVSYVGRTLLIDSVLLNIDHIYWAQVFIIHSRVLKEIEKVYRDFIWLGAYYSTNPGNVSWSKVCSLKVAGGWVYKAD